MDEYAPPHQEGLLMDQPPEPEEAEEIADADLDALDAMAEALLAAIIQTGPDEDIPGMAAPVLPGREGSDPPPGSASAGRGGNPDG
jgi:hypothetical protein